VEEASSRHQATGTGRSGPKLYYMTQVGTRPPRFKLFVNKRKFFHFSFLRYLEAQLREKFGFEGNPIIFEYVEKEARYAETHGKIKVERTKGPWAK
jgi:predicted GTPase